MILTKKSAYKEVWPGITKHTYKVLDKCKSEQEKQLCWA